MDYTTNAPQGAVFLTEKMPGWEYRVDLSRLDMVSADVCVLAQAFNMLYYDALDLLFPEAYEEAERYGFEIPEPDGEYNPEESEAQWTELGREWAQIITELRSK